MKTPHKGYDVSAGFSTIPGIMRLSRRVYRAIIGRSRRFPMFRKLMGDRKSRDIVVTPLDEYNVAFWERYLRLPAGRISFPVHDVYTHLALYNDTVVGHVSVLKQWVNTPVDLEGWWLTGLEVNPRLRCVGLGRRLMTSIISDWREACDDESLFLVVHKHNKPAIRLFNSMGFRMLQNPEWERKLRKAYPDYSHGCWNYSLMEYRSESSTYN